MDLLVHMNQPDSYVPGIQSSLGRPFKNLSI